MIKKTRKGVYLRVAANTASACTGMQFCGALRKKIANQPPAFTVRRHNLIFRGYFIDSAVVKLRKF
ncbi:hypothetical protein DWG93_23415 [Escherichia coli]|nr:hypothetical protein [Escherichia coli]EFA4953103.1 hypothetical protein [Escherichia coli]EFN9755563.1 hypothetical protein [Escherichia coli]EFO1630616.1 hypothetical protein [Escherichia coli]